MYVRGGSCSSMSHGMSLRHGYRQYVHVRHSPDMLDSNVVNGILWRWRWMLVITAQWGYRSLDTTNTKQFLLQQMYYVPRVPHLHLHMTRMHSLHTGVGQRCACIFLALNTSFHCESGDIYSELVRMIKVCLMKYALQLATAMDN